MTHLSLIYLCFTILLALIDAIRIRVQWGLRKNINHTVSYVLAGIALVIALEMDFHVRPSIWICILYGAMSVLVAGAIRLAMYNIFLGIFRIWTKTGRLVDYVSISTTSTIDTIEWWAKIPFWIQRLLAAIVWAILVWVYWLITK